MTDVIIEQTPHVRLDAEAADLIRQVFTLDEVAEMLRMCLAEVAEYDPHVVILEEDGERFVQFDDCSACPFGGDVAEITVCPAQCVYHRAFALIADQARQKLDEEVVADGAVDHA